MAQGKGRRVRDTPDENPAHLELAMTALAGVVPLLRMKMFLCPVSSGHKIFSFQKKSAVPPRAHVNVRRDRN
jgi:hypothetical protein